MIKRRPDPFIVMAVVLVIGVLVSVLWLDAPPKDAKDADSLASVTADVISP